MQGKIFRNALCIAENFNEAGQKIRRNLAANGYGNRLLLIGSERAIVIDDILLDEIEEDNAEYLSSLLVTAVPVNPYNPNFFAVGQVFGFI